MADDDKRFLLDVDLLRAGAREPRAELGLRLELGDRVVLTTRDGVSVELVVQNVRVGGRDLQVVLAGMLSPLPYISPRFEPVGTFQCPQCDARHDRRAVLHALEIASSPPSGWGCPCGYAFTLAEIDALLAGSA